MSYSSRLISNVRALFGCGRVLFACLFFAFPLITLSLAGRIPQDLGVVYFKSPPVKVQGSDSFTRPARFQNLRGEISVPAITDQDRSFIRRIGTIESIVICAFGFLTCHWLWQLCRNVERGDIFSTTNLKLVRRLGGLLIVETIVDQTLGSWKVGAVAAFVRDRVSFTGLEVVAPTSGLFLFQPDSTELNINQIIIGVLVLCLAEVFRQGLKLKQESELTV